ncbi:DUF6683 family protein [Devosia salina]|uniref:Uncharacterized protein n=1 Tax=Devosia salina TaxID=2860336 RepID=A0ABX8WJ16_9HYPH|nr:DUF6683 family protein [Devosia salina]QYO77986.1 hypothetical protein K1X15_05305 [Devosia salina]
MTKRALLVLIAALLAPVSLPVLTYGQDEEPPEATAPSNDAAAFDTSYWPSPSVSARLQREFLDRVRWSAGMAARDSLAAAFAEKSPVDTWLELVAPDGLEANNVADALTAYWVLNWVAANGAYDAKVDNAPIQRQLRAAFANDPNFIKLSDQQRQELAEGYILEFLVEHAALNRAVGQGDTATLQQLAASAVARFRQKMKVDLLSVEPGPDGFVGKPPSAD